MTSGVKPFWTNDEWYYHMRFRPDMQGVTPILSAIPPDSTRQGKDDPHGGNPENESVFELVGPHEIVIRHTSQPLYRLTIGLEPTAAGTAVYRDFVP